MKSLHGLLQLSVSHTDFSSVLQGKQFFLIHSSSSTGHLLKNILEQKTRVSSGGDAPQCPDKTSLQHTCQDTFQNVFSTFTWTMWDLVLFFIFNSLITETKCLQWKQYLIIISRADWTWWWFYAFNNCRTSFSPGEQEEKLKVSKSRKSKPAIITSGIINQL